MIKSYITVIQDSLLCVFLRKVSSMVQCQESVRTHAPGGIRRTLLMELRFRLDLEGFHTGVEKI